MNIVRKFSSYNAGPRLANSVLADYRLYHNIDVRSSIKNYAHRLINMLKCVSMIRSAPKTDTLNCIQVITVPGVGVEGITTCHSRTSINK